MRVVIDTNVLLSAVYRDRLPERVVLWCIDRADSEWLVSEAIMDEYCNVLARPKFALSRATLAHWLDVLHRRTRAIDAPARMDLPRDRKDAKFLDCALAGRADFLISGDADFDDAARVVPFRIVSVRAFASLCAPQLLGE